MWREAADGKTELRVNARPCRVGNAGDREYHAAERDLVAKPIRGEDCEGGLFAGADGGLAVGTGKKHSPRHVTEFNSRREGLRNVADVVMGMIWLALPCRLPGPPRTCGPRQSRRAPRRYLSTPRSSQAPPRRRPWGTPRSRVIDNKQPNRVRTRPQEYLKVSLPHDAQLSSLIRSFLCFFRMNAHTDSQTQLVDSRSVECWISTPPLPEPAPRSYPPWWWCNPW